MSNDWESFKRGSVLEHIKISITVLHDFFFMTVVGFLHGSQMAFHFLVAMPMELP